MTKTNMRRPGTTALVMMVAALITAVTASAFAGVARLGHAQERKLVASLETLDGQVSVRRFDSQRFVTVRTESLVGVGDIVKTDATGRARITFFANGVDTDVLPNTEFRLDDFKGDEQRFTLAVTVLVGQTAHRVTQLLDAGSTYTINSTGLEMAVRGTTFLVRVEPSGRTATIVREGQVRTTASGTTNTANVGAGFGIRGEGGRSLSEVVPATSFAELDSSLDGCAGQISTFSDFRLNVRLGPGFNFVRVGNLDTGLRLQLYGETTSKVWYRIQFKGGFGWIYASAIALDPGCVKLREYPDDYAGEDAKLYVGLDPDVNLTATPNPSVTPITVPSPTPTR
jgi:hypothetical protein